MDRNPTYMVAIPYGGWYGTITPVFMKCTYDTLTMEETLVVVDMVASQWVVVPKDKILWKPRECQETALLLAIPLS